MRTSTAFAGLAFSVAASCSGVTHAAFDGWKPHAYCNDLDHIGETKISPLTTEQAARVEELVQVQLVVRHGGRVPYARVFCWDRAGNNPVETEWTCSQTSVSSQDLESNSTTGYGRLYGKKYMADTNILRGTCVVGALLPIGIKQHLANGNNLRDAYVGEGPLKLFSSDDLTAIPEKSIYLRSDDQERTIGSGQALVDGLFPPADTNPALENMLTWNVADMATDHINTNERICPMMSYIANLSSFSPEYQRHIQSAAVLKVEEDFQALVGRFSWDSILECLSIARCNNLELPAGVDEDLFTSVYNEVENRQGIFLTYNESWYAKVTMQPLVAELLSRLDLALDGSSDAPRLAITMGHDSTIMPLMAAILRQNWDRKWTPYAGMFTMELYKTKDASHAVRLLFKGQPLKVPECADDLCDIKDFLKAVEFGRAPRQCEVPVRSSASVAASGFSSTQYLSIVFLVGLVGFCVFLGLRSRREEYMQHERANLLN